MANFRKTKRRWVTHSLRQIERDPQRPKSPIARDPGAPRIRADCEQGPRPCPWVACKHHLFSEINYAGGIRFAFGDDVAVLETMPATCVLDVAATGPLAQDAVGVFTDTCEADISVKELAALKQLAALFALDDV